MSNQLSVEAFCQQTPAHCNDLSQKKHTQQAFHKTLKVPNHHHHHQHHCHQTVLLYLGNGLVPHLHPISPRHLPLPWCLSDFKGGTKATTKAQWRPGERTFFRYFFGWNHGNLRVPPLCSRCVDSVPKDLSGDFQTKACVFPWRKKNFERQETVETVDWSTSTCAMLSL